MGLGRQWSSLAGVELGARWPWGEDSCAVTPVFTVSGVGVHSVLFSEFHSPRACVNSFTFASTKIFEKTKQKLFPENLTHPGRDLMTGSCCCSDADFLSPRGMPCVSGSLLATSSAVLSKGHRVLVSAHTGG